MDTFTDFLNESWCDMYGLDFKHWKEAHPDGSKEDFEEELELARQEEWDRLNDKWK